MGAGKKTQTFLQKQTSNTFMNAAAISKVTFRNLSKNHLGGVIFGCTNLTIEECLSKQLFGLPGQHLSYVKNIGPGLPLFLFNYSNRKLYGVFEAACSGKLNINPYGWTSDGAAKTQYPAQVQIRIRLQCQPLVEEEFRPVITDNYYALKHFMFELDHAQANKLMSLFENRKGVPSFSVPGNNAKWRQIFREVPSLITKKEDERMRPQSSDSTNSHDSGDKFPFTEDEGSIPLSPEVHYFSYSSRESNPSLDEDIILSETHSQHKIVVHDEKDSVLMKLKKLNLQLECQQKDSAIMNDTRLGESDFLMEKVGPHEKNVANSFFPSDQPPIIAKLIQEMEELKTFKTEQTMKMSCLEHKLLSYLDLSGFQVEAEAEIYRLRKRCMVLQSGDYPSTVDAIKDPWDPRDSIFLVGGYDGETWLSTFESYFPSKDWTKSLKRMNTVRAYASVAKFNDDIYVLGGGNGNTWYDTVESYSLSNDEWSMRPSLTREKGSTGAAVAQDKIFAIGGGNGEECFADVEMLDPEIGKWICVRSLTEKRFALAAAELNGAIYATGGYNGIDYLTSVERFDPREHAWTRIEHMHTKRGCHSLVVLNEKLYAIGGFDGITMAPSVEVYDPRLGSWTIGDSMNQGRGYAAAAVLNESIYVIGGVMHGDNILETIEQFEEDEGWKNINGIAIGKRSFMAAISL
ncbi:hypothetical protein ACFE04_001740 [Oxalis oulophora]